VLYGCDGAWWRLRGGVPKFSGVKVSQDANACTFFNVNKVDVIRREGRILLDKPGVIAAGSKSGGGNSGFQALNLAVQFGARKIILVGFDMRLDRGAHWHGRHGKGLNNPNDKIMAQWRQALNEVPRMLVEYGVQIINASPISALTAYPVMPLPEAIDG
jgi:hypothetical protein